MVHIGQAVVELQCPQEFGCLTGIHTKAPWANDYVFKNLRAKTVPMKLRWCESLKWLWSCSIQKNLGAKWVFQQGPDEPITMLMHIYRPRCPTELEMVQTSCGVTVSTRISVSDRNVWPRGFATKQPAWWALWLPWWPPAGCNNALMYLLIFTMNFCYCFIVVFCWK